MMVVAPTASVMASTTGLAAGEVSSVHDDFGAVPGQYRGISDQA
jgi:hypothetical protein